MDKLIPITVRFTAEEKANTEQNAAAAGLSISRFLAKTGSAAQQPVTEEERKEVNKIIVELKRIGNNVNQLAKANNASFTGSAAKPEDSEIEAAAIELRNFIKDLKQRL